MLFGNELISMRRISPITAADRPVFSCSILTLASLEPESDAAWVSCLCVSHLCRIMLTSRWYLLSIFSTCLFCRCAYCFTRLSHRSRSILRARSLLTALFGSFRASHLSRMTILTLRLLLILLFFQPWCSSFVLFFYFWLPYNYLFFLLRGEEKSSGSPTYTPLGLTTPGGRQISWRRRSRLLCLRSAVMHLQHDLHLDLWTNAIIWKRLSFKHSSIHVWCELKIIKL